MIICALMVALLNSIACSSASTTNRAANTANGSNTSSASATQSASQSAPQTSPEALVAELYKQHGENRSSFFQTCDRALVDKYFDKNLGDLIWKDAVDSKGEVWAIGADPLYDAQDTEIKNFSVRSSKNENGRAEVTVSFENFGKKQEIIYLLTADKSEWKIADIKYGDGRTLLSALKGNAAQSDEDSFFEGKYSVGNMSCVVKPVKMAFEVRCSERRGVMMFFNDVDAPEGKPTFSSEDKGKGRERFVFDDDRFDTGKFTGADGKELPVKKAR
jgi:hypothetical protein